MSQKKSTRRKAIDCKLIKESNSYPGYFKYMVTIEEEDGSTSDHPTYGKDMQDAMKRLVRSEHADKVVKVLEKKQHLFIIGLFALCVILPLFGSINDDGNKNWWMILPLVTIVVLFLVFEIVERYRSKS